MTTATQNFQLRNDPSFNVVTSAEERTRAVVGFAGDQGLYLGSTTSSGDVTLQSSIGLATAGNQLVAGTVGIRAADGVGSVPGGPVAILAGASDTNPMGGTVTVSGGYSLASLNNGAVDLQTSQLSLGPINPLAPGQCIGKGTLAAGSAVIATTSVTANSNIFLTYVNPSLVPTSLAVGSINPGVSFAVVETNSGTSNSQFNWLVIN